MNATTAPRQLPLDLAHRPAFGAEDFFVSQSNQFAVRLIDDWPNWSEYGQLLVGPVASGKSHLVNVWRLRTDANIVEAGDLSTSHFASMCFDRPVCVENIDRHLGSEEALFHLLNLVRERAAQILLTSTLGVSELKIELRDLRSRLLALPEISISSPDDDLLKAVMIKQFADRQIEVEPQLVEYVFKRMERSMQAVTKMVDALDRGSLGTGRRITRLLARDIMADIGEE